MHNILNLKVMQGKKLFKNSNFNICGFVWSMCVQRLSTGKHKTPMESRIDHFERVDCIKL